ncbi:FUSC family protein [Shewanella aestuarii]|uniref:FUSC family protein n=1 Tax=Shewanella aestuarii TaxID=1028752 RepID=A0A6G9QMH5_9GAMM|nr:FUSC family protein [Shewanella aestuarii]QIR15598.1 hypothetical protein HBH39_14805 [Shewanella aestuarii]
MLLHSTKEAIKIGLSLTIAISLTFLLGWEKPWWSAITIIAMSANETYGHSIKLASDRLAGTMAGAFAAVVLVSFFAQERFLFLTTLILFAGLATFMSFNQRYGYTVRISFYVCALVCAMGAFDDISSINLIILRLQETFLGVIVYSLVFGLIWPDTTQGHFFALQNKILNCLEEKASQLSQKMSAEDVLKISDELQQVIPQIAKMKTILDLPLNGSHQLKHQLEKWRTITISSYEITLKLTEIADQLTNTQTDLTKRETDLAQITQQLTILKLAVKSDESQTVASPSAASGMS